MNNLPLIDDSETFSPDEILKAAQELAAMDSQSLGELDRAIAERYPRRPAKVAMVCSFLQKEGAEPQYAPAIVCERVRQLAANGSLAVAGDPLRPRFSEILD